MWLAFASLALISPMQTYSIRPVPFTAVHLSDAFWAPKIEINRKVSIPFALQKCEETGRMANFERAAKALRGEPIPDKKLPVFPFDDSDVYKILEGAAYSLSVRPDPELDAYLDRIIAKIAAAQEPDGYLYTARTIDPEHPHAWSGKERWINEQEQSHELYNVGHLYEAAVAHYQATGKKTLLEVAVKSADLLDKTFGPGKKKVWPGHEVVEMGLVKLSRATKDPKYLTLAKFFLESRGGGGAYWQAHKPVLEQTEAVGHAVRAVYLYSGMADVAAATGETPYVKAIDSIWKDVVDRKLYITGGIGATGNGEAFGRPYELPNMSAYCETCAAVGNDFWNERLFLLHGDAKYVDVLERTLYNGLISGVALDGKGFFYPNPLESRGQHHRSPWFDCACCPGNVNRFISSLPGYFYAQSGDQIFVNLYASNSAEMTLDHGQNVKLSQETRYPWDGAVRMRIEPSRSTPFALKLRIPGWAREEAVPSDLYRFADSSTEKPSLKLNGKAVQIELENGYATVQRSWKKGDTVELTLPMPIRRIIANERVVEDRGRVALQRGPLVYCVEWPDIEGGKVRNLLLPNDLKLEPTDSPQLLGGVVLLKGRAMALAKDAEGNVTQKEQALMAIPYYAWANRGPGEMTVWLPTTLETAHPTPSPTLASEAKIKTSGGKNPHAINDLEEPENSVDQRSFFHWWPKKGTTEWVEMTFNEPAAISQAELYWFDDTGIGECRVPESWKLLYRDGESWKEVESAETHGVEKDRFNRFAFKPVSTTALRLEIKLKSNFSAGIQEWKVK